MTTTAIVSTEKIVVVDEVVIAVAVGVEVTARKARIETGPTTSVITVLRGSMSRRRNVAIVAVALHESTRRWSSTPTNADE